MVIVIYRAHDQLRAINVVHIAPGFVRTDFKVLQGFMIVFWWHAIIEHHAIGDFSCQFHHAHVGRPYIDGYVAWLAAPVHHVELNVIYMMEFAMEGDTLQPEQALHRSEEHTSELQSRGHL